MELTQTMVDESLEIGVQLEPELLQWTPDQIARDLITYDGGFDEIVEDTPEFHRLVAFVTVWKECYRAD